MAQEDHIKPTQEELDNGIKKAAEEAEKLPNKDEFQDDPEDGDEPQDPPEDANPDDKPDDAPDDQEDADDDDGEGEDGDEPKAPKDAVPNGEGDDAEEGTDYKEKFKQSTRESMVLLAKNRKTQQAIEQAAELPEPTDDVMREKFGKEKWEGMTAVERQLATESEWNRQRFAHIDKAAQEGKDIDAWNTKVDAFVDDPANLVKYPELEGKVEEFKIFATKPSRRTLDFEDLVLAFNGDRAKNFKPKPKGQMFEKGTGGPNQKPSKREDGKLSIQESRQLMKTDYNKWRQYLKAGKLASE